MSSDHIPMVLEEVPEQVADVPNLTRLRVAEPADYLIRLLGKIDSGWAVALGDMGVVTQECDADRDITTLCGHVTDQAALLGILNLAHGLGMELLSVEYLGAGQK